MNNNTRSERNQDATVYVGNLAPEVEEDILYELMVQVAPVAHIKLPKDKISKSHQGFGFIEFKTPKDVEYVTKVMNGLPLYGRNLRINRAKNEDSASQMIDVGATLYIGNLDKLVDENSLIESFKHFGNFVKPPMIVRDPLTKESKGYGFLYFDSFENSDKALEQMNNQYLMNKQIKIDYALKKNGKHGERHGDSVERLLAANAKLNNLLNANEAKKKKLQEEQELLERAKMEQLELESLKHKKETEQYQRQNNRNTRGRGRSNGRGGARGRGGYNNRGYSPY